MLEMKFRLRAVTLKLIQMHYKKRMTPLFKDRTLKNSSLSPHKMLKAGLLCLKLKK